MRGHVDYRQFLQCLRVRCTVISISDYTLSTIISDYAGSIANRSLKYVDARTAGARRSISHVASRSERSVRHENNDRTIGRLRGILKTRISGIVSDDRSEVISSFHGGSRRCHWLARYS